jgi:hypothetical protein
MYSSYDSIHRNDKILVIDVIIGKILHNYLIKILVNNVSFMVYLSSTLIFDHDYDNIIFKYIC